MLATKYISTSNSAIKISGMFRLEKRSTPNIQCPMTWLGKIEEVLKEIQCKDVLEEVHLEDVPEEVLEEVQPKEVHFKEVLEDVLERKYLKKYFRKYSKKSLMKNLKVYSKV